ncbi:hypothetical protein GCM10023238_15210 [Streptomyces heliomycini]
MASGGWRAQDANDEGNRDGDAELKRMYVIEQMRGRGLARRILAALGESARAAAASAWSWRPAPSSRRPSPCTPPAATSPARSFGYYRFHEDSRCYAKAL